MGSKTGFPRDEFEVIDHVNIDSRSIEFPQMIDGLNLVWGELRLPVTTNSSRIPKDVPIPSLSHIYAHIDSILYFKKRHDLIKTDYHKDFDLRINDLRFRSDQKKLIADLMGIDLDQSYYDFAFSHGYDLARFSSKKKKPKVRNEGG